MTRDTPWADFRAAEPAFSDRVAARFSCHPHHVVGTLAPDGRPRLWGSSIFVSGGHLWFGVMPHALRTADMRRDPRVVLTEVEGDMLVMSVWEQGRGLRIVQRQ